MPFFLKYEPKPFNRDTFVEVSKEEQDDDEENLRFSVENVIRWRENPLDKVSLNLFLPTQSLE